MYNLTNPRAGLIISWDGIQVVDDQSGEMARDEPHLLLACSGFLHSSQNSGFQEPSQRTLCPRLSLPRGVILTTVEAEGLSSAGVMAGWAVRPQQFLSIQSLKVQVVPERFILFVQVIEDPLIPRV